MKPAPFREQNTVFLPPDGMEDQYCALPAYTADRKVISCWQLTLWERIFILFTGRIWLGVAGTAQPPVWLDIESPFIRRSELR